ncbi:unnamed protein product, partial [Hapterophycus canaliculatus]
DPSTEPEPIEPASVPESSNPESEVASESSALPEAEPKPAEDTASKLGPKLAPYVTAGMKACSYAISLRFPLITGQPWAAALSPKLRPILNVRGVSLVVGAIVVSVVFAWLHSAALAHELAAIFDSKQWLVMLVAWAVLKVIHELGHACVAHHHGVR